MTQNGPGFTSMDGVYKFSDSLSPDKRISGLNWNWDEYYKRVLDKGNQINTSEQLRRFTTQEMDGSHSKLAVDPQSVSHSL